MADLMTALNTAAANAGHIAARPTGLILEVRPLGAIYRVSGGKPAPWAPNMRDVCADDWQAGPADAIRQALEAVNVR